MKTETLKLKHFKLHPVFGIGYWVDKYDSSIHGFNGVAHNMILPFLRIQWGWLQKDDGK